MFKKPAHFILLIIAFAIVATIYMTRGLLTYENLLNYYAILKLQLSEHYLWAAASFFVAYVLAVALSLPGALLLTLLGGLLFGAVIGGVLVILAATSGATIIFLLARSLLKPYFADKIEQNLQQFSKGFEKNAASYLLFLRLTPIFPFWLVNIAPAFFNIPLGLFVITTLVGIAPASFIFTNLASSLINLVERDAATYAACKTAICLPEFHLQSLLSKQVLFALTALGLLSLLPILYKRTHHAI